MAQKYNQVTSLQRIDKTIGNDPDDPHKSLYDGEWWALRGGMSRRSR